jgi:hypothetical protein
MINLWYSESYWGHSRTCSGPQKVVQNLIESLEECNIEYVINDDKYRYNYLIQYNSEAYLKHEKLDHDTCVIGPQIWPFDEYGLFLKDNPQYYKKLIVPGESVYQSFINQGYRKDKLAKWPVGIKDINVQRSGDVRFLVYFKRRSQDDLDVIISYLKENDYPYQILRYGSYSQEEFYKALKECSHGIIIDGPESQGIAIQEMMSSDMPLLVWDNAEWEEMPGLMNPVPTSVNYWSEECGEKFCDGDEFVEVFNKFINGKYSPKEYVKRELSYSVTVKKLLEIFEK